MTDEQRKRTSEDADVIRPLSQAVHDTFLDAKDELKRAEYAAIDAHEHLDREVETPDDVLRLKEEMIGHAEELEQAARTLREHAALFPLKLACWGVVASRT